MKNSDSKLEFEKMKIHKGPLNLNAVTMKNPKTVFNNILKVLQSFGVKFSD